MEVFVPVDVTALDVFGGRSVLDPSTRDRPVPSMGRHTEVEQHTSYHNIVVIISQ